MYNLHYLIFVVSILLLEQIGFAQPPCNEQALLSIKGSWKKDADADVFPDRSLPVAQFSLIRERVNLMQKLLEAAYPQPQGIEVRWHRNISGKPLVAGGAVPYDLFSFWFSYYCNGNSPVLAGETANFFYVWANQFSWFAEPVKTFTIHKQTVYLLTQRAGQLNGMPLYVGIHDGTSNGYVTHSRTIILTRDGASPYIPVSRKDFLRGVIKYLQFQRDKSLTSLQKYPYGSPEEKEKMSDGFKKTFENQIKPAQDYLAAHSEEDLALPAIVMDAGGFKKFYTIEEGGFEAVRLNPDYFNDALPRYVPQFLVVYWGWDEAAPGKKFHEQIEKHFDFNALKQLIDK